MGDEQGRTVETSEGISDQLCIWSSVACDLMGSIKSGGICAFPFLAAFAVAALLAGAVKFITERTHIKRGIVAVTTVLFFYILLAAVLYFAGSYLVRLIYDLTRELSVFFGYGCACYAAFLSVGGTFVSCVLSGRAD